MRLSSIIRYKVSRSALNAGGQKKETIHHGPSSTLNSSNLLQENTVYPFSYISQRNQSSIRGTKKSDHTASDKSLSNLDENILTKPIVAKSSYKTVNLAYISYEKKNQDKDSDQKDASRHKHVKSPLVIQHGLFGTKENWKTVGKELNHITNRTVYSLDGRNHGESPHTNEMTFALMAKDVRNFCEQNNHEKISFMGHHGIGGRIGMMIAMLYPEMLDKLIVVYSTPLMSMKSQQRYKQLREAAEMLKTVEPELRKCEGYKRNLAAEQAIEHIIKDKRDVALMLSNLTSGSNNSSSKKEKVVSDGNSDSSHNLPLWKCNIDAFLNNPGIINFPSFDESKAFHGKTLFVQSTKSNYISPEDESEIQRIFPNSEFSWIKSKNGSTWFHIESHTEFMQAVISFLEDTKRRSGNEEHVPIPNPNSI